MITRPLILIATSPLSQWERVRVSAITMFATGTETLERPALSLVEERRLES